MARRFLNEMKWHPKKSLKGLEVIYIHRGAPEDRMTVSAEDILKLEKSFFVIEVDDKKTRIPYHRIVEIKRSDEVLWRKRSERRQSPRIHDP